MWTALCIWRQGCQPRERLIKVVDFKYSKTLCFGKTRKQNWKRKGATGFEPVTSRSAVECSTTELYPHLWKCLIIVYNISNVVHNQMINHSCNMIPRKIGIQRIWWMSCLLFCYWNDIIECLLFWSDIEYIDFYIYVHQPNIFAVQCLDFQSVYKFQLASACI